MEAPSLPEDVLLVIFGLLPLDVRLRLECRVPALRNHAPHWRSISFSGCDPARVARVSGETLAWLLRRAGARLESLDLSAMYNGAQTLFAALAQPLMQIALPSLTEVILGGDAGASIRPASLLPLRAAAPLTKISGTGAVIDVQAGGWTEASTQFSAGVAWGPAVRVKVWLLYKADFPGGLASPFHRPLFNAFAAHLTAHPEALVKFGCVRISLENGEDVSELCDVLLACPNLRQVAFRTSQLHDNGFAVIAEKLLLPASPIVSLELGHQVFAENAIALLAAQLADSRLQELVLHSVCLNERGMTALGHALQVNTSLTNLSVTAADHPALALNVPGVDALLQALVYNVQLQELHLGLFRDLYLDVAGYLTTLPFAARIRLSRVYTQEEMERRRRRRTRWSRMRMRNGSGESVRVSSVPNSPMLDSRPPPRAAERNPPAPGP